VRTAILVLLSLMPCASLACEDWEKAKDSLRALRQSDPTASAEAAVKAGDDRFVSVRGYAESIPGVKNQSCAFQRGRPRVVDPTFDVICGNEHGRLKGLARTYANKYNSRVQQLLRAAGKPSCDS